MALYSYICPECRHDLTLHRPVEDRTIRPLCPVCRPTFSPMRLIPSVPALVWHPTKSGKS